MPYPLHTIRVRVIGPKPEDDREYIIPALNTKGQNNLPWPDKGFIVIETESNNAVRTRVFAGEFGRDTKDATNL